MYFGNTTERGVLHVVNELVSNGIDHFLRGAATRIAVVLDGDTIHYSDDGLGLPCGVPGPNGVSLAEHYLTCRHTTPTADHHAPHTHLLGAGVGLAPVNAVAECLTIKTWHNGSLWAQQFSRGLPLEPPNVIESGSGKGTRISFRLDHAIFQVGLPSQRSLRRLLFEAAHLFPSLLIALGHEVFHAPNGLADLASLYSPQVAPFEGQEPVQFALHARHDDVEVNVGIVGVTKGETLIRSWANGSGTSMHGTHVAGLRDALRSVKWKPAVAMIHVVFHDPSFASPTRNCLENAFVRKAVREALKPALNQWRNGNSPNA